MAELALVFNFGEQLDCGVLRDLLYELGVTYVVVNDVEFDNAVDRDGRARFSRLVIDLLEHDVWSDSDSVVVVRYPDNSVLAVLLDRLFESVVFYGLVLEEVDGELVFRGLLL